MSDANVTALIRIVGALTIAGCLWLAFTVLHPYPEASIMLVGTATFLYGALGFKPLDPVLGFILQKLGPAKVATMSNRPPAPTPGDADYSARPHTPADDEEPKVIRPPAPYSTDQWGFTSLYEGVIPHMYLDSLGNVTCGCGELIPNEQAALRLPWSPSAAGAVLDYYLVKEAPTGHVASWYRSLTKSRLTEPAMRSLFIQRVAAFRKELARRGWRLERVPLPGQIAVVDMAYNLGVGGPGKGGLDGDFPSFKAAIAAANYVRAADECHRRPPVSVARNTATRNQLLACVA